MSAQVVGDCRRVDTIGYRAVLRGTRLDGDFDARNASQLPTTMHPKLRELVIRLFAERYITAFSVGDGGTVIQFTLVSMTDEGRLDFAGRLAKAARHRKPRDINHIPSNIIHSLNLLLG